MHASAYQMMRAEIKQLEDVGRQRDQTLEQQHQVIQQLVGRVQQLNAQLLGERTTVKILVLLHGSPKKSLTERRRRSLPARGTITAPKAIIDELGARPYAYDAELSKDEATGDQTITVTKKSDEAIAEIEAQLKAQQEAIDKAQREQEEKAKEVEASAAIVSPDGRPARESAGKLVIVQ